MLIQPYSSKWIIDFQNIRLILREALPDFEIQIEHVGSTSVPQLAAKAIIDLDLIYPPSVNFESIKAGLATIGYFHNGDQGIPQREVFKRQQPSVAHPVLDELEHHLYVCPLAGTEWQRHVRFRDYLRKDATTRMAYQALKLAIAAEVKQDRKAYASLKETQAKSFIETVLARAL
ncbi:MAG: GrpB family protein [Saprospiraceae bacterium]